MNTTENNKLIAEFLQPSFNGFGTYEFKGSFYGSLKLKFHNDWNWLMKVVEKIESLGYDVFINTCVCRITDVGQDILEDIETFNYENKKQAVYNACVEFIKWYNKQENK